MGGLATALALAKQGFREINVYESASNLGFVGAGIQLAPNMARILDRLGVWKEIEAEAVDLKDTSIRRELPTVQHCTQSTNFASRGLDGRGTGTCRSSIRTREVRLPTHGWPSIISGWVSTGRLQA